MRPSSSAFTLKRLRARVREKDGALGVKQKEDLDQTRLKKL